MTLTRSYNIVDDLCYEIDTCTSSCGTPKSLLSDSDALMANASNDNMEIGMGERNGLLPVDIDRFLG